MKRLGICAFAGTILVGLASFGLAAPADAIANGQPDGTEHPYVGMVFSVSGDGSVGACSGVLVAPRVFVTAAHCTTDLETLPRSVAVQVSFATDAQDLVGQVSGRAHTYPGYCPGWAGGWGRDLGDVGVIVLDSPVHLPRYGALPKVGEDALALGDPMMEVGYGIRTGYQGCVFFTCFPGDIGVRTKMSGFIVDAGSLSPEFVKSNASGGACFGDSGAPILSGAGPTVLGVDSFVNDWSCASVDYATRLDRAPILAWIRSWS